MRGFEIEKYKDIHKGLWSQRYRELYRQREVEIYRFEVISLERKIGENGFIYLERERDGTLGVEGERGQGLHVQREINIRGQGLVIQIDKERE